MTSKQAFLKASTIFVLVVNWRAGLRTYVRARARVYVLSIYLVGGGLIIEANIPVQELEGQRGEGAYFREDTVCIYIYICTTIAGNANAVTAITRGSLSSPCLFISLSLPLSLPPSLLSLSLSLSFSPSLCPFSLPLSLLPWTDDS